MKRLVIDTSAIVAAALLIAAPAVAQTPPTQTPAPAARPQGPARASAYTGPRTPDGKPNLNGIWQVISTAHWNLEPHSASEGVPAGLGVVEGGEIPYQPAALATRKENFENRLTADPLRKCHLPGVPRSMYLPFPFEITQTPTHVGFAHEFAHATRMVYLDGTKHLEDLSFYMGDSRGRWEGDTLVVDTVSLDERTWLDSAGNHHSDALRVVERFTPIDSSHIDYEATLDDPKVFTRPWKINMIIYRRLEKNIELLEYECSEHFFLKLFKERAGKK